MTENSRLRANAKYQKQKYDSRNIRFPRGAIEQLTALAEAEGVSLNRYILEAVEQRSGLKLTLDGTLPWIGKK